MAVTVKKATLWRKELSNRPGTLSDALKPFADSKSNLQVVMGYVFPNDRSHAAVEVYPVTGKKAEDAARKGGLTPANSIHCLLAEGGDEVGLAHRMAEALSKAGVNINFAIIQVIQKRFMGVFGFDSATDAAKAAGLLKGASRATAKKARPAKKSAKKAAPKKAAKKSAKKATAKKSTAKKAAAKKSTAKKSAAKKPAKKPAAKKKR